MNVKLGAWNREVGGAEGRSTPREGFKVDCAEGMSRNMAHWSSMSKNKLDRVKMNIGRYI